MRSGRIAGFALVAATFMMAVTVLAPSVLLGSPIAFFEQGRTFPATSVAVPGIGAAGDLAGSTRASVVASTDDRGPFTVTFSMVPPKSSGKGSGGGAGLEITFRACNHGTCCDVYIDDGEFAGVGNCFTFTPLPSEKPIALGSHPDGGTTANLTVSANETSATFTVPTNTTVWYAVSGPSGYRVVPAGGSTTAAAGNLTVSGANVLQTFSWAKGKTYSVKYSEKGLIPGTAWCVLFSGCASGKAGAIGNLTPGVYLTSVAPVVGYSLNVTVKGEALPHEKISFQFVTIAAKDIAIKSAFTPNLFATTLNETGLAVGKRMHLAITCSSTKTDLTGCYGMKAAGTCTGATTGCNVTLMLRNGTYTWKITPIKGYTLELNGVADPTWSGTFTLAGQGHHYIGKVTLIK